jgi:alkanesulfonate monooxygenase SsuD/methylene tetrahydromethanopterin reductase-like flavin-dependent oxidoreductase (luciferase family)
MTDSCRMRRSSATSSTRRSWPTSWVSISSASASHRADFAVSAPEVVLAAIAGRTSRIRLGSAVPVLSSDDPVRVVQRFATLDAASNGRAEVILGRGSFTESFPLFGYELSQYEELFEEKLDLFATLIR